MQPADALCLEVLSQPLQAVLKEAEIGPVASRIDTHADPPEDDHIIPFKLAISELTKVVNDVNLKSQGALRNFNNLHWNLSSFVTATIASGSRFHICNLREIAVPTCAKYPYLRKDNRTGILGVAKRVLDEIKHELVVLCHQPVREHRNIVKLRGLGWMDVGTPGEMHLPVLFLETAQLGSLTTFLQLNHPDARLRAQLVEDIGVGLLALHRSGIVHGDLKPDNILICTGDSPQKLVAKISDFGSSTIVSDLLQSGQNDPEDQVYRARGASGLWNAPEWRKSLSMGGLLSSDTYSFGLVAWSIYTVAPNPFGFLDLETIENLKSQNLLLQYARSTMEDYNEFESSAVGPNVPNEELFERRLLSIVSARKLFDFTLDASPDMRSLSRALSATSLDSLYGFANKISSDVSTILHLDQAQIKYSALHAAPLPTKRLLIEGFELSAANSITPPHSRSQSCFQVAMAAIDGFSAAPDFEKAFSWVMKGAELGFEPAMAVAHRLCHACDPKLVHSNSRLEAKLVSWLTSAAEHGTPFALKYLQSLDLTCYLEARQISFAKHRPKFMFEDPNVAPEMLAASIIKGNNVERTLARPGITANDFFFNEKLDTLLHFGAAYGVSLGDFSHFIDRWTPDIDQQNEAGDTPLLAAMRAGNGSHAITLLHYGAKAHIANKLGQIACHWIIQFDDHGTIDEILDLLQAANAVLSVVAKRDDLKPDVNFTAVSFAGTPLHWTVLHHCKYAVRALLQRGADPLQVFVDDNVISGSVIDLALHLWEYELVSMLIDSCSDRLDPCSIPHPALTKKLPPWLRKGTSNWTIWTMVTPYHWNLVWHGANCLEALSRTLEVLQKRGLAKGDLDYILAFAMIHYPRNFLEVLFDFFGETITSNILEGALSLCGYSFHADAIHFIFEQLIKISDASEVVVAKFVFSFICSGLSDELVLRKAIVILRDVDIRDSNGDTLFAVAVRHGNFDAATSLLVLGANANVLLRAKNTEREELEVNILHELILHSNDSVVSALNYLLEPHHPFKDNVPSFVVGKDGSTALQIACLWDCDAVFQTMLRYFGDVQSINAGGEEGYTPLHSAVVAGRLTYVRFLCEAGANANARTNVGLTPRDLCSRTEVYQSQNISRPVAYQEAVLMSRLQIDSYLRKIGGTTTRNKVAMKMPIAYKFLRCSILSAFPQLFDEALGLIANDFWTQSHLDSFLFFAAREGTVHTIERLLHAGANPRALSRTESTPLHMLAARQTYSVVKLKASRAMLLAGADPWAKNFEGRSPVSIAYDLNDRSTVRFLLSGLCVPVRVTERESVTQESEADQALRQRFQGDEMADHALLELLENSDEAPDDQSASSTSLFGVQ